MNDFILITGGAGFIGSHLVEHFRRSGKKVVALDNFSSGSLENLIHIPRSDDLRVIEGSILDLELVNDLMSKSSGCIHMAAAVGVKLILEDPVNSLETNLTGSKYVLDAARRHKKKVLIASTSEIYGKNSEVPLSEESDRVLGSPLLSRWTYSEAKAIEEAVAFYYFKAYSLDVRIVRLFNTVGPRQSSAYGMVIPSFVSAALRGEKLLLHGGGEQTRTFCHVEDVVRGIVAIWNSEYTSGVPINLGGSEETSIKELANLVLDLTGSNSSVEVIPYEEIFPTGFEDTNRRKPDIRLINHLTGWRPRRNLNEIILDTVAYQRERI